MGKQSQCYVSKRRLAAYLLLWNTADAQTATTPSITDVTSVATVSGSVITEVYTPTSASISGLTPPITAGTTITTTDSAGQTVAIAVAAGAGVVAGGALAAWLFKPVPGAPPAPTSPPPYSTVSQPTTSHTSSSSSTTSTTPYACPYPSAGLHLSFYPVQSQPQLTVVLPPPTTSVVNFPKCTQQGSNSQLLRGADPGYINALAQVFCKSDLSKDQSKTLGQADLPSDSSWKTAKLDGIKVKFDFNYTLSDSGCPQNCVDAYAKIVKTCQYDSHTMYGGGSLKQGCGSYGLLVDAAPNTKLTCAPLPNPIWTKYEYRDAAVDAINNFCKAHDGNVLKQDKSANINELVISAVYADGCTGSGTYTIKKDLCVNYLMQTLDGCDTATTMYKHGGTLVDTDNCGSFTFHPTSYDTFACYPNNVNSQLISSLDHVTVTPAIAQDAISQFCDRDGNGQTYTLKPNVDTGGFVQDTCTEDGAAACGYYYKRDGSRATSTNGQIRVRMSARYWEPSGYKCNPRQTYAIHGQRCHKELSKVLGVEPQNMCVGDPNKLDLGSFVESSENGCVLWNMWATKTLLYDISGASPFSQT